MGILIVDDSLDTRLLLKNHLNKNGFSDVLMASNALEAFEILNIKEGKCEECQEIDLILMDVMMPGMDGIEACHIINECESTRDIPLIMVTAKADSNALVRALEEGAMDYIKKPFDKVELLARIRSALRLKSEMDKRKAREKELMELNEKLEKLTSLDGLTNISNRRYFDDFFQRKLEEAKKNHSPISLIMLDLDQFKAYNDTYGHLEGDQCLKKVSKTIFNSIDKNIQLVARYGGEEFAVVLPYTDEEKGKEIAEQIRKSIVDLKLPHKNSKVSDYVTVSLGMITFSPQDNYNTSDLIQMADDALYYSKQTGRNRVTVYNPIMLKEKN